MSVPPDPTSDPAAAAAAAEAAQQHVAAALTAATLAAANHNNNNITNNMNNVNTNNGGIVSPNNLPRQQSPHGLPSQHPIPQGAASPAPHTGPTTVPSPAPSQQQQQQPPKLQHAPPPPPPPSVHIYSPASHAHLVLYLAALHGSCITHDGLSGTFAPPLNHVKLLEWWKARLASPTTALATSISTSAFTSTSSTAPPAATVFLLLANNNKNDSNGNPPGAAPGPTKVTGTDLVGVAMVRPHVAETSPHVAVVELLLVNPRLRVATPATSSTSSSPNQTQYADGLRLLLDAVEQHVVLEGKTLLTAETEAESPAAKDFLRLGFAEAGRIPGFLVRPSTTQVRDQSILYKNLATL